ncbi:MAG TPA: hypothetical protein VFG86_22300 [Chloroflexota bacterium]|nr:hypothetical protein [Chloroflexota bacterium]
MKLLTTLLVAVLVGLIVYAARRRIWLALRIGGITYVVVLVVRLIASGGVLADRWDDLVWPVFGLLVAWAVLWLVSTRYEQRKRRR